MFSYISTSLSQLSITFRIIVEAIFLVVECFQHIVSFLIRIHLTICGVMCHQTTRNPITRIPIKLSDLVSDNQITGHRTHIDRTMTAPKFVSSISCSNCCLILNVPFDSYDTADNAPTVCTVNQVPCFI